MEGHERSALKDRLARLAAANALAGREPDDGGGDDAAADDDEAAAAVAALAGAPRAAEQGASDEGGSSRGPSPADPADAVALLARPEAQVVDVARAPDRAPRKRGATASERSGARTTFVDPPTRDRDGRRRLRRRPPCAAGRGPGRDGDGDGAYGDDACSASKASTWTTRCDCSSATRRRAARRPASAWRRRALRRRGCGCRRGRWSTPAPTRWRPGARAARFPSAFASTSRAPPVASSAQ